jgi:hypothetical protein
MGRIVKWNKGTVKSAEDAAFEQRLQETAALLNAMLPDHLRPPAAKPKAKPRACRPRKPESPNQLKIEYRQLGHLLL